ncbi:MAG: class I adenylate-forming enzyme family protein [Rhodospirillaceae bacterium]|nr:class I adenylate-forming enzyme family protein [Rhodospirillaceae bacterium]
MTTTAPERPAELPDAFQHMTMANALRAAMYRAPGKVALRHGAATRTYGELVTRMDRATNAAIADLGLKPGDHAALIAKNGLDYIEIVCGVAEAGAAVATVNPRLSVAEIVAICDDAQAKVAFADRDLAPRLREARFATVRRIIELGPDYEAWLATGDSPVVRPAPDELRTWVIYYTSGTTGRPKGVLCSHRSRLLSFYAKAVEYGCFGPDDRFLAITPMCFGGGLGFPMNALVFGGFTEIMDRFDAAVVLRKLADDAFTGVFMVPTHFHEMFALDPATLDRCRSAPIGTIISNAAPLSQAMKERIVAYFGPGKLHELYASTEAGLGCNIRPADQLRKVQCVGLPFPGVFIRISRDDGTDCAPDEIGELFCRSPYLFSGYWNRPDETAAAWKDGWVTVGDLARRDTEGYVYIVGRKKDMVITGGVNVYPREVEEVLHKHPAIAEAAVVGVPDAKWGERLKAFIVPKPGARVGADDVAAFCAGKLASYKIPKDVAVIAALPRNANGKVIKAELARLG